MFRGDLDAELAHYHPRGKAIIESFVQGVNAYISETERNPSLLPLEFKVLGLTPGRWTPAVVISRHQSLTANLTEEVRHMRALKHMTAEALRDLNYIQGGDPVFTPDAALDPKRSRTTCCGSTTRSAIPMEFRPEDVIAELRAHAPCAAASLREAATPDRPTPDATM